MLNCYIYTHYTLGIGHLQRAKLIAKELSRDKNYNVILLCSGQKIQKSFIPKGISFVSLPGEIRSRNSRCTKPADSEFSMDEINKKRIKRIIELFGKSKPDIFITEFFPFAPFRLEKTLLPVLDYIKKNCPECMIACSARDIPVSERGDNLGNYDFKKLNDILERYYDFVVIHSPKNLSIFKKGELFERFAPKIPVYFTRYIVEACKKFKKHAKNNILITTGGGRDGEKLIINALRASEKLEKTIPLQVNVVKGPFSSLNCSEWEGKKWCKIYDYLPGLCSQISMSDLVVCMAGYNTIAEVMANNIPALVCPRNDFEQKKRVQLISAESNKIMPIKENMTIDGLKNKMHFLLRAKFLEEPRQNYFNGLQNTVELIRKKFEKKSILNAPNYAIKQSLNQSVNKLQRILLRILPKSRRIFIIGWGKAVDPLVEIAIRTIPKEYFAGAVYLSLKPTFSSGKILRLQADHPIVSARNLDATKKLIDFVRNCNKDDVILAFSTGGGSAMLDNFRQPASLKDMVNLNKLLLKSNIDCHIISALRCKCSNVKSGKLLRYIPADRIITLIVSDDVLLRGQKSKVRVASEPTYYLENCKRYSNQEIISELCKRAIYSKLPDSIRKILKFEDKNPVLKKNLSTYVLSDNLDLINNAKEYLKSKGFNVKIRDKVVYGEVKSLSEKLWKEFSEKSRKTKKPFAYIAGGEPVVNVKRRGKGGRCQELVANLIKLLPSIKPSMALAVSSDGIDNIKEAAGAFATSETYYLCSKKSMRSEDYIRDNNTFSLHKELGTLIPHFYTGTNIGDLIILAAL